MHLYRDTYVPRTCQPTFTPSMVIPEWTTTVTGQCTKQWLCFHSVRHTPADATRAQPTCTRSLARWRCVVYLYRDTCVLRTCPQACMPSMVIPEWTSTVTGQCTKRSGFAFTAYGTPADATPAQPTCMGSRARWRRVMHVCRDTYVPRTSQPTCTPSMVVCELTTTVTGQCTKQWLCYHSVRHTPADATPARRLVGTTAASMCGCATLWTLRTLPVTII
jgi:hypothetical protein